MRLILTVLSIAVIVGLGLLFFYLWQADIHNVAKPSTKISSWRDTVIENLTKTVLSSAAYSDKTYAIQKAVSQTNLGEFSEVVLTDLKSDYSDGEKVEFNLTIFGYHNWCLFPNLSLYHEKYDAPVWESGVAGHCPAPAEVSSPRVSYWKSTDFYQFPFCRYAGMYTLMGESFEFGPKVVGKYYCHGAKEFQPPKTIQMDVPFGASDPDQKRNFEPSEITANWGDSINFTNNDDMTHVIIGESERTRLTDGVKFYATMEPGQSFQMKMLNNGTNWIFSETTENKRFYWMKGIVHVD